MLPDTKFVTTKRKAVIGKLMLELDDVVRLNKISWLFQNPLELGCWSAVTCTLYVKEPPLETVAINPIDQEGVGEKYGTNVDIGLTSTGCDVPFPVIRILGKPLKVVFLYQLPLITCQFRPSL